MASFTFTGIFSGRKVQYVYRGFFCTLFDATLTIARFSFVQIYRKIPILSLFISSGFLPTLYRRIGTKRKFIMPRSGCRPKLTTKFIILLKSLVTMTIFSELSLPNTYAQSSCNYMSEAGFNAASIPEEPSYGSYK